MKNAGGSEERVLSRSGVINLLDQHGIPWRSWGTGTSRTLDDFLAYHQRDRLNFREGCRELVIDVRVAVVIVVYKSDQWLELYEDRQEFPNGRVLRRSSYNGVSETIRRTETYRQAARRCLAEELQFYTPSKYRLSRRFEVQHREPVRSEKFTGLLAAYHRYIFECTISDELFRSEGYVENEDGRLIYFKWKPRS